MVLVMVKPVPEVRPNAGHDLGPVTKQVRAKTSVPVQSATALISTTAVIRLKCFTFTDSSVLGGVG
jgi:hypothetical protein